MHVYATVLMLVAAPVLAADAYPVRSIRFVAPIAPGGSVDIVSRAVAQKLTERLGQQVVVDNRPGAGGNIGAEVAARSAPDGYTLFMGASSTFGVNPTLYGNLRYDAVRDFAPVSMVSVAPNVLVVHSLPVASVADLVALAKARPGALSYASSGIGGAPYFAGVPFRMAAGVRIVHVPYKGTGQAVGDLIAGQIPISFGTAIALAQHVKAKRLRALAVTWTRRVPALPELPTMAEAGLKGVEVTSWNGIAVPAGTPTAIVARLNAELVSILSAADFRDRMSAQGAELQPSTPEAFGAYIRSEIARWGSVIRAAGISVGVIPVLRCARIPGGPRVLAWLTACLPVAGRAAEGWPARPVRLIVPFTPGGGTDLVARALAQRLGEAWKQQVVVDNRGGGGTVLATEIAAAARADGHTPPMATTTLAINPSLRRRLPYDTLRQLSPVTQAAAQAYLLVVQPALPVRSVRELLALAREPGQLNYGSPGTGSGGQLSVELLKLMTKTDMTHVPYKGGAAALTDLLAGQIQFMFPTILPGLPHVKSGKPVALGVSTARRSPVLPDLPTVAESGVPGFEAMSWMGLVVPAGTPPAAVVARIHRDVAGLLHLAEVRDRIAADGAEPVGSTPEAFGAFIRAEIEKWGRVVRAAGIEPD